MSSKEFDFKDPKKEVRPEVITMERLGVTPKNQVVATEKKYNDTLTRAQKSLKALFKG